MSKRIFLTILSICYLAIVNAQQLSSSAKVYLWTYAPDVALYSSYGHDAIRVYDPEQNINYIYNYGTFDAGTDNFYVKFAQGRLNYTISAIRISNKKVYRSYLARLEAYGKTITENEIQLDSVQRQGVFDYLENNALPENREYLYDFFFDNCATRVRDILVEVVDSNLQFGVPKIEKPQSFRDMHRTYMAGKPWAEFGIDFLLGAKSDRIATPEERMYIPQEMYETFKVSLIDRNGQQVPLVGEDVIICESDPIDVSENFWTSPLFVFWIIFGLILFYTVKTWEGVSNRFDKFWFILMGILGLVIFLMWFATDHRVMVNNWNLLWLNPTYLLAAFALYSSNARKSWLPTYFKIVFGIVILTLASWLIIPQSFHPAFMPLMLTIILRSYYQIKKQKQQLS
jgi:hypothetical protein